MEKQRLQEEYDLMIPRAQIAEQKRQFNLQQENLKDAQQTGMYSDAVSGIGNMYLTNKYINAVSPAQAPAIAPALGTTTTTMGMGGALPASTLTTTMGAQQGTVGLGSMSLSGATPPTMGINSLTVPTSTPTAGMASFAAPVMAGVGGGMIGGALGKSGTGRDVGKALLFDGGGRREHAAVSGSIAGSVAGGVMGGLTSGAASGAAIGGSTFSVPGAVIGTIVGGLVGAVSALFDDSWICTACHRIAGMSKEEIDKMGELREYCEIAHKKWLDSYIVNAPLVVKAIAETEQDLLSFYTRIHEILIEPIFKEHDLEKCFEIYLSVVKSLFEQYTPEFEFKEAE
jgi:hypothetical protein